MDPETLTRPPDHDHIAQNGEAIGETRPDWHAPSDAPASVTLGWCVAEVFLAARGRLAAALPDDLATQLALELTRAAITSPLTQTLLVRRE